MINAIEFFSGSQQLTTTLNSLGINCISLDNRKLRGSKAPDHFIDFLEFDYKMFHTEYFNVLYFGFPCTAFSKASGGKHFNKRRHPLTATAHTSIKLMMRMFEIIDYFSSATFYIENPAGGLANNYYFANIWPLYKAHIYRLSMDHFGFPTTKQTDLFTNSSIPFLFNRSHRVNGKYSKQKFSNLSLNKRQSYTPDFCNFIASNIQISNPQKTYSVAT